MSILREIVCLLLLSSALVLCQDYEIIETEAPPTPGKLLHFY